MHLVQQVENDRDALWIDAKIACEIADQIHTRQIHLGGGKRI
ncbi:MAG: hypothetical protein ABMA14_10335 [Hyphomonadaceae bacterium]